MTSLSAVVYIILVFGELYRQPFASIDSVENPSFPIKYMAICVHPVPRQEAHVSTYDLIALASNFSIRVSPPLSGNAHEDLIDATPAPNGLLNEPVLN